MQNITVFDSIMGSGKTSHIIERMSRSHLKGMFNGTPSRFVYVTPLLDEVDRVKEALPDMKFKDPKPVHGKKYFHFEQLLKDQENIATTHELFKRLTRSAYDQITAGNYTLVIDEVLTCCDIFSDLKDADRKTLFETGMVYIEEATRRLRWNHEDHGEYAGRFEDIKNMCDNGNLCVYGDSQVILWQFPIEFLKCFDQVYILTYLFEGSPMRSYLEAEGVSFKMMAVEGDRDQGFTPVDWRSHSEAAIKAKIKELVTVYEGPLNDIGAKKGKAQPFSKGWLNRQDKRGMAAIRAKVETFFKTKAKTPSPNNSWTTFSDHKKALKGKCYSHSKCWIPLNTKATNQYAHKRSMAYLSNRFALPPIKRFFEDQGIDMSEDIYALSEMIQVLWRTAIRNDEPVMFYIPSERMRGLFHLWLSTNNTAQLVMAIGKQKSEAA
jgi:hypothetical protein